MRTMKDHFSSVLILLLIILSGCSTISQFDQHAYIQTTSVKVDALRLMNLATENYSLHVVEVNFVTTQIDKAYEYERNRPKNELTLKLWDKLRDTSGHLFGGFIQRWNKDEKLSPVFIRESKKQVSEAFDIIAQLESKKIKPKQVHQ